VRLFCLSVVVLSACGRTLFYEPSAVKQTVTPPKTPYCGDGNVDPGEQCDDGNTNATDDCLPDCTLAHCGDGYVHIGVEECDPGNNVATATCTAKCAFVTCGNGKLDPGEECDDGNMDDTDACLSTCIKAHCGDGFVEVGVEQCDDGNSSNTDLCTNACQLARCGDGFVEAGVEQCDDGNSIDNDYCDNTCKLPVCGDGKKAGSEECDLGAMNGDRPAFLVTQPTGLSIASDALVREKTAVDFYDYFSASSHTGLEEVGESRIYLYVDSDTGRLSLILTHGIDQDTSGESQPASVVTMHITGLPSGVTLDLVDDPGVNPPEATLSGSTADGDWHFQNNSDGMVLGGLPFPGVWSITVTPTFTAGITTWGYVRSDAVRIPLDMTQPATIQAFDTTTFCRTNCTIPRCGDGILEGGEVCDDGNTVDGDGCSSDCKSFN
jgi:cysteine-rich repeat protein